MDSADLMQKRVAVAAEIARASAATVDTEAHFPAEAFAELRRQRLLGVMIPVSLGGEGADLATVMEVCFALGRACSSTALIYAMHQIKMACIVRHACSSVAIEAILREAASEQYLFASSTTEGQAGGNVRASEAAVEHVADYLSLQRQATVISYARFADGIVTTARRSADAATSDQVLLVLLKRDYALEPLQGWDTLGMRGTCSEGFSLRARAPSNQMLPEPYAHIHTQTMVPYAHLLWGTVWAGIASAAVDAAQAFCRQAAAASKGQPPPGASHLTEALSQLTTLRTLLQGAVQRYEMLKPDTKAVASLEFQSMVMLLKVQASELALSTVLNAMRCCGLSGYRNDSRFSLSRQLRDILSAPLMINNQRILSNLAASSLVTPLPSSLRD